MKKSFLLIATLSWLLCSCDINRKEKEDAQRTIDSLNAAVIENQKTANTLAEIATLMDSIDASRHILKVNMIEGTTYQDYVARMLDLNDYVKKSEKLIAYLEKQTQKLGELSAYKSTIKKMRSDLEAKTHELETMQEMVAEYQKRNTVLSDSFNIQKMMIAEKINRINEIQKESDELKNQVNQLMVKSTTDQAESYFARAAATEETARRTHFAPRKKKKTIKEALELYHMALVLGKEEAQTRIDVLAKKI